MNPALKHLAEATLIASGAERISRARFRDRTLVLAYHNIVPESESAVGDTSLHLRQRDFSSQLDALAESHDVVSIRDLFAESSSGRPRVVITFDDAYLGSLTAGMKELAQRGMPATVFIAPGLAGSATWWDVLAEPEGGVVPEKIRHQALQAMQGKTQQVLEWARVELKTGRSGRGLPKIGTLTDLGEVSTLPGITFGSHTWSHPNLCMLSDGDVKLEMSQSLEWLRSHFSNVVSWLSYPYGFFNQVSRRSAAETGYLGAMRIDGGWVPRGGKADMFAIPRFNVPSGLSLNGFRLRLAGL